MTHAGFKAPARRLCAGHAHSIPVRWNCAVEVFGRNITTARDSTGKSTEEILAAMDAAARESGKNVQAKFRRKGEWG